MGIDQTIDQFMRPLADAIYGFVFYAVPVAGAELPLIVVWLIAGGLFFTLYLRFINVRGFQHALQLVSGRYADPLHPGEVTHFQALATAVSGTVGIGNIAGVAVAISVGGPGATLWMIIAGLLGMSTKFAECTLAVKFRHEHKDRSVSGGPMYFLERGLDRAQRILRGHLLVQFDQGAPIVLLVVQLVEPSRFVKPVAGGAIETIDDLLAEAHFVTGTLASTLHELEGLPNAVHRGRKAPFVASIGCQDPVLPDDQIAQSLVYFGGDLQGMTVGLRPNRDDDEFLNFQLVRGQLSAVEAVHQRHRQNARCRTQVEVEGHATEPLPPHAPLPATRRRSHSPLTGSCRAFRRART